MQDEVGAEQGFCPAHEQGAIILAERPTHQLLHHGGALDDVVVKRVTKATACDSKLAATSWPLGYAVLLKGPGGETLEDAVAAAAANCVRQRRRARSLLLRGPQQASDPPIPPLHVSPQPLLCLLSLFVFRLPILLSIATLFLLLCLLSLRRLSRGG